MTRLDDQWFTEIAPEASVAFSLRVEDRLHHERSEFQEIEIYSTTDFGHLMVIDGCIMLSTRDNFLYHEMMVHPALAVHRSPKNVVIIGGGDCGTLREVLRHDIDSVVQIDIDERVTRLSEKYFPELCESNDDPRATLLFADGIDWMARAETGSVDVIIVDSTDPVGPAVGLFQQPFYDDCLRVLRDDGIFVQQSESPILYLPILTEMHRLLRSSGFEQTRPVSFPQPVYPSGWWSAALGFKAHTSIEPRLSDAAIRDLGTRYYNRDTHQAGFAVPSFVAEALASV